MAKKCAGIGYPRSSVYNVAQQSKLVGGHSVKPNAVVCCRPVIAHKSVARNKRSRRIWADNAYQRHKTCAVIEGCRDALAFSIDREPIRRPRWPIHSRSVKRAKPAKGIDSVACACILGGAQGPADHAVPKFQIIHPLGKVPDLLARRGVGNVADIQVALNVQLPFVWRFSQNISVLWRW